MATINLPHVEWRDGRPRFNPSRRQRALGFVRTNLQGPAGDWMTLAQVQAWLAGLEREIATRQAEPAPAAGPVAKPVFVDRRPASIRPPTEWKSQTGSIHGRGAKSYCRPLSRD